MQHSITPSKYQTKNTQNTIFKLYLCSNITSIKISELINSQITQNPKYNSDFKFQFR